MKYLLSGFLMLFSICYGFIGNIINSMFKWGPPKENQQKNYNMNYISPKKYDSKSLFVADHLQFKQRQFV